MTPLRYLTRPREVFAADQAETFAFAPALRTVGALLLIFGVLLLATEFLPKIEGPGTHLRAQDLGLSPDIKNARGLDARPVQWYAQAILFPLGWAVFIGYAAVMRGLFARVLGDTQLSMRDALTLTLFAVVPLLTLAGMMSVLSSLVAHRALAGFAAVWLAMRIAVTILFLFAGVLWEGWIATAILRARFEQNPGRAVLTWLAPYFACVGLTILLNLFI